MAELIDKSKLLDSMDDRYKAKRDIVPDNLAEGFLQMEKLIKEQPTTTEAEIRAMAIDEFTELLKKAAIRGAFEYKPDKKAPWRKELVYCKVVGTRKIDEIAKQLKEEYE